jgi:hypothetical protein
VSPFSCPRYQDDLDNAVAGLALGGVHAENRSFQRIADAGMKGHARSLDLRQQADDAALVGNGQGDLGQQLFGLVES